MQLLWQLQSPSDISDTYTGLILSLVDRRRNLVQADLTAESVQTDKVLHTTQKFLTQNIWLITNVMGDIYGWC